MNPLPRENGAKYRIPCVGESTMFGVGGEAIAPFFNYQRQLGNMLREKSPGLKMQVFCDGKIRGNTAENLINLPSVKDRRKSSL